MPLTYTCFETIAEAAANVLYGVNPGGRMSAGTAAKATELPGVPTRQPRIFIINYNIVSLRAASPYRAAS